MASLSESEQATKALFELHDKEKIEAVSMNFEGGQRSLCISSQVTLSEVHYNPYQPSKAGCALACNFCATGAVGFKRQLTADEITDQVLFFQQLGQNIDSISFMGMGEPFMNPEVFRALDILTNKYGFKFSQRRLSISTVGIIPAIQKLTRDFPNVIISTGIIAN